MQVFLFFNELIHSEDREVYSSSMFNSFEHLFKIFHEFSIIMTCTSSREVS